MNRLAELIKELEYKDLILLKKDLDEGNIKKLLVKSIDHAKKKQITLCPVCNGPVRQGEGFHLEFGKPDFRKKATFDGKDCLQYFLEHHIK